MQNLKLSEAKEGTVVVLDDGFTCIDAGKATVHVDHTGPFFTCKEGNHYLDGQVDDDDETLVGIYRA